MRTLVWFRGKDLRLADHVPLHDAIRDAASAERAGRDGCVVPLFVVDPYFFAKDRAQEMPNRIRFLLESLAELSAAIADRGSELVVVHGKSVDVVPAIAKALEVGRVVAHRWSEPVGIERDRRVSKALAEHDIAFDLHEGETMAAPGEVLTGSGTPYSVFTPFARAFAKVVKVGKPIAAPRAIPPLPALPASVTKRRGEIPTAESLGLDASAQIVAGGERAAKARLARFLRGPAADYERGRNAMGEEGTSRLSQDLKFGTLSARTVWTASREALDHHPKASRTFLNELVWRDFAYDVLRARPQVQRSSFRPEWKGFPWRKDERGWRAWEEGKTGYPVVDAAARQLLGEGFVHNRARMISASFLCKHLLVDYKRGEALYMKHLTDGDWASNNLGWQWSAGCGVDAQPWFRVFNPVMQGKKFDPEGTYVKRWVPELAKLPPRYIHAPWEAPPDVLAKAGVRLGASYPEPIVEHVYARKRFLAAAEGHLASAKKRR